jgi:3-phosphoshikimate 1-carboxyvinyltransferase
MSHRALILGGLASGETRISGLLEGDDVLNTAEAVRAFGAEVDRIGPGEWRVRGTKWQSPAGRIDCGNSGTGARLLMGAAAAFPIVATFTGDASLSSRPMERILVPLRAMGARTEGSTLPVTIHGGNLHGISFVNEKASAQVKSAILLAGLNIAGITRVIEPVATRDHSERILSAFGADIKVEGEEIALRGEADLRPRDVAVPGDPSAAAFPLVAALLVPGSQVRVEGVGMNPGRTGLFRVLQEMGADLTVENMRDQGGEPVADLTARSSRLRGVDVPPELAPAMIDEFPILFVAAAFAQGTTRTRGLAELRVKESDRLAAMAEGLAAIGARVDEAADGLVVHGSGGEPLRGGGRIDPRLDHRIAMSFAVAGLACAEAVTLADMAAADTSFPGFEAMLAELAR